MSMNESRPFTERTDQPDLQHCRIEQDAPEIDAPTDRA